MNPFEILGVSENATQQEIKKAYRTLALKYHPDKSGGDEDKFREIQSAYELINTEQKVKSYKNRSHGSFVWDSDLETYFKDFFTNMQGSVRKKTVHISIVLTLEEAFQGVTKTIQYKINETCHYCGGTGATTFDKTGRAISSCDRCFGVGSTSTHKQTSVSIPRSVTSGTTLIAEEKDVIVNIQVAPHSIFEINGTTVYSTVNLPFIKVFDNSTITADTLHGKIEVQIPRCVQPEQMLRLKGKGLFDNRKNSYGDHIIKIKIEIPRLPDDICEKIVSVLQNKG
jgi:molecular chaperone DnaJ